MLARTAGQGRGGLGILASRPDVVDLGAELSVLLLHGRLLVNELLELRLQSLHASSGSHSTSLGKAKVERGERGNVKTLVLGVPGN